jgi:hypothetical protein
VNQLFRTVSKILTKVPADYRFVRWDVTLRVHQESKKGDDLSGVSVEKGLKKTVQWYKKQLGIKINVFMNITARHHPPAAFFPHVQKIAPVAILMAGRGCLVVIGIIVIVFRRFNFTNQPKKTGKAKSTH